MPCRCHRYARLEAPRGFFFALITPKNKDHLDCNGLLDEGHRGLAKLSENFSEFRA